MPTTADAASFLGMMFPSIQSALSDEGHDFHGEAGIGMGEVGVSVFVA
jgi:hypothetical protein